LVEQGDRLQAADLLAPIHDWFSEGFDSLDIMAKALLDELRTHEKGAACCHVAIWAGVCH
jgi:hypothetical protein